MAKLYDCLILGAGPAGLSAALSLGRVHRTCVVFSNSSFRNAGVHHAHAILGHDGKSPEEIRRAGRREIDGYGHAEFAETTVEGISRRKEPGQSHEAFVLKGPGQREWAGRTLVLASGSRDSFPDLAGFADNWPDNIFQCLFCDGHERSHLTKGILAYPRLDAFVIQQATTAHFQSLTPGAGHQQTFPPAPSKVTVFANGPANPDHDAEITKGLKTLAGYGISVDERPVVKLVRDPHEGVHVHLADATSVHMGFLFHKPALVPAPIAQQIASQLGLDTTKTPFGTFITTVPPANGTKVPGLFVAGDVGTMMTSVTNAFFTGALAGAAVTHFLNELDDAAALKLWKDHATSR